LRLADAMRGRGALGGVASRIGLSGRLLLLTILFVLLAR
jgi:hypothetical protein